MKRVDLSEQVYQELAARIVSGRYPGGAKLTEEELCREFGISRTPVREALFKLEAEEMIEALPRRGVRVRVHDAESARELFACRRDLELLALGYALDDLPETELAELEREFERLADGSPESVAELVAADERMHRLLADHCGNRHLRSILLRLLRLTAPYRSYRNRVGIGAAARERLELVRALRRRDRAAASPLLAAHIDRGAADLPL